MSTDPSRVLLHNGIMMPQLNPARQRWNQQDQAILSAFVSSMTESVVGMVLFASTAREAWETLEGAFASTTIARSSGIRQQMVDLKKHDQTMTVYFHRMKALADQLTSIGHPLRDTELISYIMGGLDKDYDPYTKSSTPAPMPCRSVTSSHSSAPRRVGCPLGVRRPAPSTTLQHTELPLEALRSLPMALLLLGPLVDSGRLIGLPRPRMHRSHDLLRHLVDPASSGQDAAVMWCVSCVTTPAMSHHGATSASTKCSLV
jgi:hypothetical protein